MRPVIRSPQMLQPVYCRKFKYYNVDTTCYQLSCDFTRNLCKDDNCRSKVFQVDRNDSFSSYALNLTNLSELMSVQNSVIRQLIIDRAEPRFKTTLSKDIVIKGKSIFKRLNKPQQKAIFKTLMSEDFILIRGMPGTGCSSFSLKYVSINILISSCSFSIPGQEKH